MNKMTELIDNNMKRKKNNKSLVLNISLYSEIVKESIIWP